jgi:hypothetical protein
MRIGLDFDNTIVSYDALFYRVALEKKVIPPNTPVNKVAVRDHLRAIDQESIWTEMQGIVYGARMDEAQAYPGVIEFMKWAGKAGHDLAIISHKTLHPFLGSQYDLHAAARAWVDQHLLADGQSLISSDRVYFELTKEEKLARIAKFGCDLFLDDLPEILMAAGFPLMTRRVLFDPESNHDAETLSGVQRVSSWREFAACIEA